MSFFNDVYFNYYSIGTIIAAAFFIIAFIFLINIPRKTSATFHLALSYIMVAFHATALFAGHWVYTPLAAYHRFLIPLAILSGLTHFNQIFFHFPKKRNLKTAKFLLIFQYSITLIFSICYMIDGLSSEIVFSSSGHYWTIDMPAYNTVLSYIIMTFILIVIVNGGWSIVTSKDKMRKTIISLLSSYIVSSIIPGLANTLNRLDIIDRGTFITLYAIFIVMGYFLILIIYINNINDRISIMGKITGVGLVVTFLILEVLSFAALKDLDKAYIQLKEKDVLLAAGNIAYSKDMLYAAAFNADKKLISFKNTSAPPVKKEQVQFVKDTPSHMAHRKNPFNSDYHVVVTVKHNDITRQSGFRYRDYRSYIHKTAVNFFYILVASIFFILLGYPLFFKSALIKPVASLLWAMNKIHNGEKNVSLPVATTDEIGDMTQGFNSMSRSITSAHKQLRHYADNLEIMVKERTKELAQAIEESDLINESLLKTNEKLEHARRQSIEEMKMAVKVQNSFIPLEYPRCSQWDIAFVFIPMKGISGDMYDFYTDKNKLLGLSLFDVSGHGIASGLITMLAKSIMQRKFKEMKDAKLNQVMESINDDLIYEMKSMDNFITAILLRMHQNHIEYVNAGHPDLMIQRAASGKVEQPSDNNINVQGTYLGLEFIKGPYSSVEIAVDTNDTILIFSDCLIESRDKNQTAYGVDRLRKVFSSAPEGSSSKKINHIMNDFYSFIEDQELQDDLSIIIIKKIS